MSVWSAMGTGDPKKSNIRLGLALAVVTLFGSLFFVGNLADPLLSDDWHHAFIASHRTQPLWQYFLTNYEGTHIGSSYRPLVNVYWAIVALFGHPTGVSARLAAHTMSLFFHVLSIAGVFALAYQLRLSRAPIWAAVVAALFFAVFPNHSEPVIWAAAVSDPITAASVCFSLVLYLRARDGNGIRRRYLLTGAYALWLIALFAKEHAVILPLLVVLWEVFALRRTKRVVAWRQVREGLLWTVPFFVVLAGYAVLRYSATGLLYGYYGADLALDPLVAIRSALAIPLSAFFSGETRTGVMGFLYALIDRRREGFLLVLSVIGLLAWLRPRRTVWWLVGGLAITMLPVLRFGLNHVPGIMNDEGERYAYLPSVFVALLLGYGVSVLWERVSARYRWAVGAVACLLLAAMGVALVAKNQVWHQVAEAADQVRVSWPDNVADAVVVVGLPDNDRGVPMWRNGFEQALAFDGQAPADLLVTPVRTAMNGQQLFTVKENASSTFIYRARPSSSAIVGPRDFSNSDITIRLSRLQFSVFALSYRDFARQAAITFSDALRQRPVDALFWEGRGWRVLPLMRDDNGAAAGYTTE